MEKNQRKKKSFNISILIFVIVYLLLFAGVLFVNRMELNFFMGIVSISGIFVALQMAVAILMTLVNYKVGGGIAKVLLIMSIISMILGMIRMRSLEALPGILEILIGFVAVTMIQLNKAEAERIYNKDTLAIKSISGIFLAMYFLDLKNDTYSEYSAAESIRKQVGTSGNSIKETLNRIIVRHVDEDMKEQTLAFLDMNTISERMKGRKIASLDVNGETYGWCRLSFIPVKYDADDNLERLLLSIQIVDDEKRKELIYKQELLYQARHDELTGLYNRNYFLEQVKTLLDSNPDVPHCMICMDIKNFRLVNELLGKERADQILINIANILKNSHVEGMKYARLSADRFAACIREDLLTMEQMQSMCDKVACMEQDSGLRMHVHVGVYKITNAKEDPSVMCDKAIEAINVIKNDYQKNISYYDEMMRTHLFEENVMVAEMETALAQNQFTMYLQPQVSNTGDLLGAEALVRWIHPEKGLVPPGEFIPVLEKSGQIVKLDRIVWELACQRLKEWENRGLTDLHISVNISPKDFYYVNLYEVFTGLVNKYQINPANLKLEITETAIMTEVSRQTDILKRLREFGFEIEIDDFGSGYSSLNTLENIEVDVLKLDMGFLRQSQHNERSRTVLNFVIVLAKSLGLVTVTEGVETEEQVEALTVAGCDIFQGYYFSKPIPVEEFEKKYSLN